MKSPAITHGSERSKCSLSAESALPTGAWSVRLVL